jgi:intein/homing endonuclease
MKLVKEAADTKDAKGQAKKFTLAKATCISCSRYINCTDDHKAYDYRCDRFKSFSESEIRTYVSDSQSEAQPNAPKKKKKETKAKSRKGLDVDALVADDSDDTSEERKFDINKIIDAALKDTSIVPLDVRINDSEMAKAPNFYTFCTGDKYIASKPYLEQAIIGTRTFSEWCPRCSDAEWLLHGHKVDDSLTKFEKKVALLEHGICPYCHKSKSKFVKKGLLDFYNEMAICAGQRCVSGDTLILTQDGLMEIGEYAGDKPLGFSPFILPVYNGQYLENTSDFYISKKERLNTVKLTTGHRITCTDDHPLYTLDKFVLSKDLRPGDHIEVNYGGNVFGNKLVNIRELIRRVDARHLEKYSKGKYASHYPNWWTSFVDLDKCPVNVTPELCQYLGIWVAEGRRTELTNFDQSVLDFCEEALASVIERSHIEKTETSIRIAGLRGRVLLETMLGQSLTSGSAKKCVPLIVRQGPKEYQTAFLRGLFEGDGGCYADIGNNSRQPSIQYTTISKRLAMQVSAMLMNIGVVHRIRERKTWATNGTEKQVRKNSYTITIIGKFLSVYSDNIGFMSKRKTDKLNEAIAKHQNRERNTSHFSEIMPSSLKAEFLSFLDLVIEDIEKVSAPAEGRSYRQKMTASSLFGNTGCRPVHDVDGSVKLNAIKLIDQLKHRANVPLTREKLRFLCWIIRKKEAVLSRKALLSLQYFESFVAKEKVFYAEIASITKSKKARASYDFTLPETHKFVANSITSSNSGKSALFGMMAAYQTHRVLKLQKPNEVYSLSRSNILHGTFVALTYDQAKDTLWEPYYGYLIDSPWFSEYHKLMDYYANKYNEDFIKLKDTFVLYRHRNLIVYPSGPDKRTLRGRTRILAGIDELGWFDSTADSQKVKTSANEVYIALERSLLTVRAAANKLMNRGFSDIPNGYFLNISSPSSVRDKIVELVRISEGSRKIFGMTKPTWEMNPTITQDDLAEEFKKDPIAAMRDYGAQPPLASNAFITNQQVVEDAIREKSNGIRLNFKQRRYRNGDAERYAEVIKIRSVQYPSVLAIDAGHVNNSFACTSAYLKDGKVIASCVAEVIPYPGVPVNFTLVYKHLISRIIEAQNVKLLIADRWNSIKILSDAREDFGIEALQYSLKYKDIWLTKDNLMSGMIRIPQPTKSVKECVEYNFDDYPHVFDGKPVDHLVLQTLTVRDTGNQIVKGDGGLTDDLFRSLSLAVYALLNPAYEEILLADNDVRPVTSQSLTVVKSIPRTGSIGSISKTSSTGSVLAVARRCR